jgi:hypothetical protein
LASLWWQSHTQVSPSVGQGQVGVGCWMCANTGTTACVAVVVVRHLWRCWTDELKPRLWLYVHVSSDGMRA